VKVFHGNDSKRRVEKLRSIATSNIGDGCLARAVSATAARSAVQPAADLIETEKAGGTRPHVIEVDRATDMRNLNALRSPRAIGNDPNDERPERLERPNDPNGSNDPND
jgi:hypothetical protein